MRSAMSGFDLRRICCELQDFVGSYCKKIYQPHHEQLVLRLNPKESTQQDLIIVRGKRVYLSARDRPMPMSPPPFAMLLRKHLRNARLVEVAQHGFDRILRLSFDTKFGPRHLVIECFRDGNAILCDENYIIIQPLTHAKYSARILKRGEEYRFPPEAIDPHDLHFDELFEIFRNSDADIVRTLASKANLGGPLATAVVAQTDLDVKTKAKTISQEDILKISSSLAEILHKLATAGESTSTEIPPVTGESPVTSSDTAQKASSVPSATTENPLAGNDKLAGGVNPVGNPGGWLLLEAGDGMTPEGLIHAVKGSSENELDDLFDTYAVEASPVCLPAHRGLVPIPFKRFADAVNAWKGYHDSTAHARKQAEKEAAVPGRGPSTVAETLERRIHQQKGALEGFKEKVESQQELGHAIQEHWTHVDELLNQMRQAIAEFGWSGSKKKIKSIPWFKSLNPSDKTFIAALPGEDGQPSGKTVTLYVEENVHQNAQRYFSKARKQRDKSSGAVTALAESETRLARAEKRESKRQASGQVSRVRRSKRLWFERHRWTILDGMHLMVGGRDAKGNDAIVKKHLKSDDLYFHADLHGAPSCSMKLTQGFEKDPHPPVNLPKGIPAIRLSDKLEKHNFSQLAIDQAASMSLCWSRGWSGGGAHGTSYWVKPSQVSKTAQSGEFVAKGAFIVRGKRNWFRDLNVKIALGLVCINGIPLLLGGAPEQVSAMCERWIEYSPGRIKKEHIANKIAKATGIPTDDILGILPGNGELGKDYGLLKPGKVEEE